LSATADKQLTEAGDNPYNHCGCAESLCGPRMLRESSVGEILEET
jgi:hypothetical protein